MSELVEKKIVTNNYSTVTFASPNLSNSNCGRKKLSKFSPNWSDFVQIGRISNLNFQISAKKLAYLGKNRISQKAYGRKNFE
jgi:hypothetical protein